MKRKEAFSSPAVGGSSLLVIFSVLCLTVFALLSLSTVQAEKRLSDKAAQSVSDYYRADLEAEKIYARLRSGETVPGVMETKEVYRYSCPVSENQTLWVELQKKDETWAILRWQVTARMEESDDTLPVWDGK